MVNCQAFGCNNDSRKGAGKTFYIISNPEKYPEKSELIARWLHNIGTGWTLKTFKFTHAKRVCEDHFAPTCFGFIIVNHFLVVS